MYMYATRDEATVGRKGVKGRTNMGQILNRAICGLKRGFARNVWDGS